VRLAKEEGQERMILIMEEALEKEEEALAACRKKGGATHCLASLQKAELDLISREVSRAAEFQQLQEKAQAKVSENVDLIDQQIQALTQRRAAYVAAMEANAKAHAERNSYLAERNKQKIAAVRSRLPPAQPSQLSATQVPVQGTEDAEMAAEDAESKELADYMLPVRWAAAELPVITETTPAEKMIFAILAKNLEEWLQFGAGVRFSFSDLLNAPTEFIPAMHVMAKLLGPVMTRLYTDRKVLPTDTVPNALGFPLQIALMRLDPAHMVIEQPAKEVIVANAAKMLKSIQKKMKKSKAAKVE
jgi:hypothetical protein